jgi:hypothetical protein
MKGYNEVISDRDTLSVRRRAERSRGETLLARTSGLDRTNAQVRRGGSTAGRRACSHYSRRMETVLGLRRCVRMFERCRLCALSGLRHPSFNISLGAIETGRLYQAGLGFVASIDLRGGRFVWKHTGLYDQQRRSFNAFSRPEVIGSEVIFREEPAKRCRRTSTHHSGNQK